MKEHKLKGVSCANCAADIEKQINKLEYGESASVQFNSSKLKIDEKVDLKKVEKILANDGASLVTNDDDSHDHDHDGANIKKLLLSATGLFIIALLFSSYLANWMEISLYVLAIVISGYSTFIRGAKNLLKLKFNIDTLMTVALTGAVVIGEWKEATVVAILFGLNEYLEGLGMEKARKSMEKLLQVAPKQATVIADGNERVVSIKDLQVGDIVLVRAGEKIPSDGIVIEGKSSVNEAAITGESLPVEKDVKEKVFGGSINNEGVLKVKITKVYEDSSLAKILHLVEQAQETKTPTELFINRFAKYYTPLIMIIAAIVITIPPLLIQGEWSFWIYQGLAVLIVGCPCALILSSPIAIVAGITRNARNGILVKGGVFLEQLGKISVIAFDKTGTLTKGKPHVNKMIAYENNFLEVAGAIESSSSHPLAKAIMETVHDEGITFAESEEIETVSGHGIVAKYKSKRFYVGNEKAIAHLTLSEKVIKDIEEYKREGLTLVIITDEERVLGIFGISDEVRAESASVINLIHEVGIKETVMLTGDHLKTAEIVANKVGVKSYYANLLPEQKVKKVEELIQTEKVAMIGDGINDAPALAVADLGIAMGKGTDSAIETADIVLMQDHLEKLPSAISIAKRMNKIIKFNITVALGLKVIALLLTIPGWLTLWIAILADMGATIFVTLVSLTLLIERKK